MTDPNALAGKFPQALIPVRSGTQEDHTLGHHRVHLALDPGAPPGAVRPLELGDHQRLVILLGEEGSGRAATLRAVAADPASHPSESLDCRSLGLLDPPEFMRIVRTLAERPARADRPKVLTVENTEDLATDQAKNVLGVLRAWFDRRHPGTEVFLSGQDAQILHDGLFSGLSTVSNVYRLAWWTAEELAPHVAEAHLPTLIEWTGGQPTLVGIWSRLLADGLSEPGPHLRDRPPTLVRRWQGRLSHLVRWSAQLQSRLKAFVAGQELPDLPHEAVPLFLAGWVHLRPGPRPTWVMPRCHRHWARDVALRPDRYREIS